jgi:hypothetical protein
MIQAVRVSRCESRRRPLRLQRQLVPYTWPAETRSENLDGLRQEYSEACSYHRHYNLLRFGILGVYFAVIGVISAVALGVTLGVGGSIRIALTALITAWGLFLTLAFWLLEALCERKIKHFAGFIGELESRLGYRPLVSKSSHWLKTDIAIRLLFALLSIAWLFVLILSI